MIFFTATVNSTQKTVETLTTNAFFSAKDLLKNVSHFINLCLFEQMRYLIVILGLLLSKFVILS